MRKECNHSRYFTRKATVFHRLAFVIIILLQCVRNIKISMHFERINVLYFFILFHQYPCILSFRDFQLCGSMEKARHGHCNAAGNW